MTRYSIIIIAICFITLSLFSVSVAESELQPTASFPETKYNFGNVKKGVVISHDFIITNEGEGVLRILELVPA